MPSMAWRGASLHQKSPCLGEVSNSRNTATARSPRQARSRHFELDDRPADGLCMFSFRETSYDTNILISANSLDDTAAVCRPQPKSRTHLLVPAAIA